MVFLAGKSPYIRSYTVYIYTVLANPIYIPLLWPQMNRDVDSMMAQARQVEQDAQRAASGV
jgi:hypothetical protein